MKIAVIGAGLAGVVLAKKLANRFDVTIFDKSRGIGGRMATRRTEPYQFDHGAQFFYAKTEEFQNFAKELESQNIVARWNPEFAELEGNKTILQRKWGESNPHYVAVPRMNQICKHLAQELDVQLNNRIEKVSRAGSKWLLQDENRESLGEFDWVISAAPAQQTAELLPSEFKHKELVDNIKMQGCYSLMIGFEEPLDIPWQAALVKNTDISWMSVNSSKPGRKTGYSILVNSTNKWAEENIDADQEVAKQHLLGEASFVIGQDLGHAKHVALHRWRYANIGIQQGENALIDFDNNLAACGDWCIQGRVESAFISATYLADKILEGKK